MANQPFEPREDPDANGPALTSAEALGPPPRRWNWRVMVVIFLIVLPVMFGIYLAWQAFSPPDPSGFAQPALALWLSVAA